MSEGRINRHPDLFELAAWAEDSLTGPGAAEVERHVAACPACRLELDKLERFGNIDQDAELAAAADWETVQDELSAPVGDRISPGMASSTGRPGTAPFWRWVAPVAVAAVLLVAFLPGILRDPKNISDTDSPLRGDGDSAEVIEPLEPRGEIAGPPRVFIWKSDEPFDSYALKIFTPELEPVFEQSGIRAPKRAVTDSLLASLRPGQVYLWTVTGQTGFETMTASAPARFEISDIPPQR